MKCNYPNWHLFGSSLKKKSLGFTVPSKSPEESWHWPLIKSWKTQKLSDNLCQAILDSTELPGAPFWWHLKHLVPLEKKNTSASAISPSVILLKSLYLNPFSCLYKEGCYSDSKIKQFYLPREWHLSLAMPGGDRLRCPSAQTLPHCLFHVV